MMRRYKQPHFDVHPDGEWIRYSDYVEAMNLAWNGGQSLQRALDNVEVIKRIAGDSAQQAECTCPSGDGSLRHPCPIHPRSSKGDDQVWFANTLGKSRRAAPAPASPVQNAKDARIAELEKEVADWQRDYDALRDHEAELVDQLRNKPKPSAAPEPRKLLSDDRILRIAEMIFGLHSADISDHIWTTFARAIERETGRIPSVSITSSDLWTEVCNILPDGEFNPDKHVYLTQQQLAACAERVMERQAEPSASPAALTDEQIDGYWESTLRTDRLAHQKFARAILNAGSVQVRTEGFRDCIDAIKGAIAFGQRDTNPAPDGHWLAEFWEIGRRLAASPAKCDGTVSNCPNECSAPCSPSELPAMTDAQIETMLQIREHEPTIFIEDEILSNYDEMREEVWEAIKVYADIHARAALQQCRALLAAEKKCTRCEYIGHCDCEVTEGK